MRLVAAVLFFVSISAFAVTVAECPAHLKVTSKKLKIRSTLETVLEKVGPDLPEEQEDAIGESYENLRALKEISVSHDFWPGSKNGRCQYKKKGNEKIVLFTEKGVDQVFFQTDLGPRGTLVRAYATVAKVSPQGVELTEEPARIYIAIPRYPYEDYSAGGPLVGVGDAASTDTAVK